MSPAYRPKTAFQNTLGLFQRVRKPFGLVSAPPTFVRVRRMLHLEEFSADFIFDDVLLLADFTQDFIVQTDDASNTLGAVFVQEHDESPSYFLC